MLTSQEKLAAGAVLRVLNLGRNTISPRDIDEDGERGDSFFRSESNAEKGLEGLERQGLLLKTKTGAYRILGDIALFRRLFLEDVKEEKTEEEGEIGLAEILSSIWTVAGQTADGQEPHKTFEELLRERRGQSNQNEDENDNDEDEDGGEREDDDADDADDAESTDLDAEEEEQKRRKAQLYEGLTPTQRTWVGLMERGGIVYKEGSTLFVYTAYRGLWEDIGFAIRFNGSELSLTDHGETYDLLSRNVNPNREDVQEKIQDILSDYGIEDDKGVLVLKVSHPATALTCMMQIYAAEQRILAYGKELFAASRKHSDGDEDEEEDDVMPWLEDDEEEFVGWEKLLLDPEVHAGDADKLTVALGTEGGEIFYADLADMEHIIIGGSAWSGKSVLLNLMIAGLILNYTPDDVRLILCDSAQGSFGAFKGMPHLLTGKIYTTAGEFEQTLQWAVRETERRFALFGIVSARGVKTEKFSEYLANKNDTDEDLPRILIMVDELADCMEEKQKEITELLCSVAQGVSIAAAGIHLILATQCPRMHEIEEKIIPLMPTRIAFKTALPSDGVAILGEKIEDPPVEMGQMVLKTGESIHRIHVFRAMPEDIASTVSAHNYPKVFSEEAKEQIGSGREVWPHTPFGDPYCVYALGVAVELGEISVTLLQRNCGVGYTRAIRILDWMEAMGFLGDVGEFGRKVLLSKEEFLKRFRPE